VLYSIPNYLYINYGEAAHTLARLATSLASSNIFIDVPTCLECINYEMKCYENLLVIKKELGKYTI
jgi:hypothetical protein